MKKRQPLQPNTMLTVTNHAGGKMCYTIGDVVGMGGSCIVYDGYYINNVGKKNTVRIKECFPYRLQITRAEDGTLCIPDGKSKQFKEYVERLSQSFDVANELHQTSGLVNQTSNVFDLYEANHTHYIVTSYVEGCTLENIAFETLGDAVRVALSTAKAVANIHAKGYLYLDIKPENILMYEETPELIQLFDFDSMIPIDMDGDITEYKIAYSDGFAPMEQKMGKLSGIGVHTDIYSMGALVFFLLFGRAPKAIDYGMDTEYDFTNIRWNTLYQEKVYKELSIFFHHTLQAYPADRYQSMEEVVTQLAVIEKYAALPVPFICSAHMENASIVVGREKECKALWDWYCGSEKLLFVYGMGGIGKSTIIRKFVSDRRTKFDAVIYLQYRESMEETVTDDTQFCITGYEKRAEETTAEYFARKIKAAKALTLDMKTLLIIDNFDGELDEEFREVLQVNWKIIAVTRKDMHQSGFAHQKIGELEEKRDVYALFERNMGRGLSLDEYQKLNCLAESVAGHTLSLVLIARQIAKSYMDIDTALKLVKVNGFSNIAPEKVDYMQDGKVFYDKIASILMAVYDVSKLSEDKKKCLKLLSLFDMQGIDIKEAEKMLEQESLDIFNELTEQGWLEISGTNIQMHPLIRETMHHLAWNEEYRRIAILEMQILMREIEQNGREFWLAEEKTCGQVNGPDYQKLRKALTMAKSIVFHAGKDAELYAHNSYWELMCIHLLHMPKEQEEYIIGNAKKVFENALYIHVYAVIELYDYVVYLLCQKGCHDKAWLYLEQAKSFAKQTKNPYIWGVYYDMLGDYEDYLLDGAYYPANKDECIFLKQLFSSVDKSMYYMKKAIRKKGHDEEVMAKKAQVLYIKYGLGKVTLRIRSVPEKSRQIKKLLFQISHNIKRYSVKDVEIYAAYYMVWAWYYTLCEPEEAKVFQYLEKSEEINEDRFMSDLDKIDYFYIPAANMMCELGNIEQTLCWLEEACNICDTHEEEAPYIRKKKDLLGYKLEVI